MLWAIRSQTSEGRRSSQMIGNCGDRMEGRVTLRRLAGRIFSRIMLGKERG